VPTSGHEFYHARKKNVENRGEILFRSVTKVWLSTCQLSRNQTAQSQPVTTFSHQIRKATTRGFHEIHAWSTTLSKEVLYCISRKYEKRFSHRYEVTHRQADRRSLFTHRAVLVLLCFVKRGPT
jgi:hypothetical protein